MHRAPAVHRCCPRRRPLHDRRRHPRQKSAPAWRESCRRVKLHPLVIEVLFRDAVAVEHNRIAVLQIETLRARFVNWNPADLHPPCRSVPASPAPSPPPPANPRIRSRGTTACEKTPAPPQTSFPPHIGQSSRRAAPASAPAAPSASTNARDSSHRRAPRLPHRRSAPSSGSPPPSSCPLAFLPL